MSASGSDIKYTIAAIPTVYRGRQYRSRLEARWAAFFDLLGFKAEYEPFDLGAWSPDFMLTGPYGAKVLVEVKPISAFHPGTAGKMIAAVREKGWGGSVDILLLGVCPTLRDGNIVMLGWHGAPGEVGPVPFLPCFIGWHMAPNDQSPALITDIMVKSNDDDLPGIIGLLWHCYAEDFWDGIGLYPSHCMELWARASNVSQWGGPTK